MEAGLLKELFVNLKLDRLKKSCLSRGWVDENNVGIDEIMIN